MFCEKDYLGDSKTAQICSIRWFSSPFFHRNIVLFLIAILQVREVGSSRELKDWVIILDWKKKIG